MAGEKLAEFLRKTAANPESFHTIRHGRLHACFDLGLQTLQRANHGAAPSEVCARCVSAILTMAGKCHDDHRCENAKNNLRKNSGNKKANAMAALIFKNHFVDGVADDAREKHNESVYHTLK